MLQKNIIRHGTLVHPTAYDDLDPDRRPSLAAALVPVLAVVAFLGIGSAVLGLDPHPPLLWSIAFVGAFGLWLGYDWDALFDGIANGSSWGSRRSSSSSPSTG